MERCANTVPVAPGTSVPLREELVPQGFASLVLFEPLLSSLAEGLEIFWDRLDRLFLPLDRLVELAEFRVTGRERLQRDPVLPLGQLAGLGGVLQRLLPVADLLVRAGGEEFRQLQVSVPVFRVEFDRPLVI